MRILRFALLSFLLLFLLITGISLFFPAQVRVSRAVDIHASDSLIYSQLSQPEQWRNWFPGVDTLDLIKKEGKAIGVRTPNGNALLLKYVEPSQVTATGKLGAAIQSSMGWNILGDATGPHYTVQWYMDFEFDWYPWEKFASLLLEPRYGPLMESGLQQLKNYCEQQP
jgi:hypothetical protein